MRALHLILCWHFHQPDYRTRTGYFLPWTYLHAMKDYVDMAVHLEAQPGMRAVVNFVPTLLEQLDDYRMQLESGQLRDPLLARLADPRLGRMPRQDKRWLLASCFRLNTATMLDPFPAYRRLHDLWRQLEGQGDAALDYLSGQYFADLVTWYHLAWTGETVRRQYPLVLKLMQKGANFTPDDRQALLKLIQEVIGGLIPRYRALAERGQVELSTTPHSHPIAPLLIDFRAAREARPELPIPEGGYPGGADRVRVHVHAAQASHAHYFGRLPGGMWPAEGGVSQAALDLFSEVGVGWVASGEGVLRHSLKASGWDVNRPCQWLCRPYRPAGAKTVIFFRDDYLSDLIGFEYKHWFARDAVRHFLHSIEDRYHYATCEDPVVTVILDGENPWDHYPYNGWYFLSELYSALSRHPDIRLTTFTEYLGEHPDSVMELPHLTAGSWVYGDFTTWMGHPHKNRAWELLCAAKGVYDRALAAGNLAPEQARQAESLLRSCESSDWFWWFGDANPAESVQTFDRLFREKLGQLYGALGLSVPGELTQPISLGGGAAEAGGVMRRGS